MKNKTKSELIKEFASKTGAQVIEIKMPTDNEMKEFRKRLLGKPLVIYDETITEEQVKNLKLW